MDLTVQHLNTIGCEASGIIGDEDLVTAVRDGGPCPSLWSGDPGDCLGYARQSHTPPVHGAGPSIWPSSSVGWLTSTVGYPSAIGQSAFAIFLIIGMRGSPGPVITFDVSFPNLASKY